MGKSWVRCSIFLSKKFVNYCEKKNSCDREKHLIFEAEGQELAKILRSHEEFIQTVQGQDNFW